MFEGWVYQLVAGYLGNYIKDFQREQFRIGLWSGVALVENAELRLEAFDYLQLPFAIKQGFVGKLRLQIPWKTLFWEPILIALEDVYICAYPREESEFDADASESRAMAAKKAKLAAAEITKLSSHVPDEKVRYSLLSHLLTKFIASIQVTVRNIHIRYINRKGEDNFDFGVKLAGLTVTDAKGASAPVVKNKSGLVHKSVEINQFAVYWNSASSSRSSSTTVGSLLTKWFMKKDEDENWTYILNPMDVSSKLTVNRSTASAQYSLNTTIEKLDLNLGNRQVYEMFLLWDSMKVSKLRERYGRFRPDVNPSASLEWQRSWWQYAIKSVCSDVQRRLRRTSWRYLAWRLDCRRRYVDLYMKKLECFQDGKPPARDIITGLEELERELDMDMILLFRSIAEEKCHFEGSVRDEADTNKKNSSEEHRARQSRGWLNLLSFGILGGSGDMDTAAEITGPLSNELMKDLYEATKFHPTAVSNGEYNLLAISLQLAQAVARLESSATKQGVVEVALRGVWASFKRMQGLATAAVAVKSLEATDVCTESTYFRHIVQSKGMNSRYLSSKHKSYAEAVYAANTTSLFQIGISQRELNEAVFCADIEVSDDPNLKVVVVVKPLEIVYSPRVVSGLLRFMRLPKLHEIDEGLETLDVFQVPRNARTRMKLMVTIDVRHPALLIPESITTADCALVVHLDSVHLALTQLYSGDLSKNDGKDSEFRKTVKARLSKLTLDFPLPSAALEHFEIKVAGLQVGIGKGSADIPFLNTLVNHFDIQLNLVKYQTSLGSHWKVEGSTGDIFMSLSPTDYKVLKSVLHPSNDASMQVEDSFGDIRLSQPPNLASNMVSGHFCVSSASLKLSIGGASSAAFKFGLEEFELKLLNDPEQREITVLLGKVWVENLGLSNECPHKFLLKKSTSEAAVLTLTHTRKHRGDSSKLLVHLRKTQCNLYPKAVAAVAGFFHAEDRPGGLESASNEAAGISCRIEIEDVSVLLYEDYGVLAMMTLPRAVFDLLSDDCLKTWELEGTARDLQLTGPDFATQGLDGIPIGSLTDGRRSSINLRLVKGLSLLDILISLQNVECILQSDYLALLIGFFRSSDWSSGPQASAPAAERVKVAVQYKVELRESLLLLPIGRGCFGKIIIPSFDFAFIPADVSGDLPSFFSRSYPRSKAFYVMGRQLSLSFYGLNSEAEGERCCLPLINRLDGDILIEVPEPAVPTRIDLRCPVIAFMLVGDRFLSQIKWVEIISTDLATVGKKAFYARRIWACLSNGENFVMENFMQKVGGSSLDLLCCIDDIRLSVASFKKGKAETILVSQADTLTSVCALRAGELDSLGVKVAGIKLLDGGRSSVTLDSLPNRTPAFEADTLTPVQGRMLVLFGSDDRPLSATLCDKTVDIVLPSLEVWLHFASWGPLISWIFFCFPVLPPVSQDGGTTTALSEDGAQLLSHVSAPQLRIQVQVPHLALFLAAFTALPQGDRKFISFTMCFYVDKLEFAETKCNFSAHLSQLKAELNERKASTYCFVLGGDVQIEGALQLGMQVILTSIISIASVDCWCSYPVLQFLSTFDLEPPSEEEDSVVVDVQHVLEVHIANASLLLTDGRWNYNCPLLEIILGNTFGDISICLGSSRMVLSTSLEVSYHNIQKAVWEPFLEPWSVSCALSKGYAGLRTKVEVTSMDPLNINVTEGLAQAACRALEMISWTRDRLHHLNGEMHGQKVFSHYAPYWFQNDTGVAVWYSIIWPTQNDGSSDHLMLTSGNWHKVLPGCSVPLFVDENEGFIQHRKARWSIARVPERKFGMMLHRRMSIRLEGTASASLPMSIDLVGCRAFEVAFSKVEEAEGNRQGSKSELEEQHHGHIFATRALFEVSLQHHSKLIRLRSTVCIANMTSLVLEVRLEIPFGIAPKIMDPISPNDIIPLPVHVAETARVRLRPYGKHFLWSEPHSLSKLLSRDQKNSIQRPVVCYPPKPNQAPFRCCICVEEKTASAQHPERWRMWNVILKAPFLVKNCLPCILNVEIESNAGVSVHTSVPKGDCVSFYEVDIVNDLNLKFSISGSSSSLKFGRSNGEDKSETGETLIFNPDNSAGRPVYARVDKIIDLVSGRREISISVPYWIYNCSGLDLAFLDADSGLHIGKEQILPNAYGKGSCVPADGLRAIVEMTSGYNACWQHQSGKLVSHLPSYKLRKPVPAVSTSGDNRENSSLLQAHLYSPAQGVEVNEHKMRLRALHSSRASWTQPFQLDPPGGTNPIVIPQPDSGGAYVLCISSMPAMGACSGRTKTITFRPRFILANASRQDICFKQQGTDIIQHLPVGQNVHVHWTDTSRSLLLSVRYNEHGWDWSGGFPLDQLGDTQVKVHNHCSGSKEILRVEVSNPDAEGMNSANKRLGTFFIIVTNDQTGFMPYRVDNFTAGRLRFYQKRCEEIENVLQPYSSCDYAWDEPCLPPLLVLEIPGGGPLGAYELETVKSYPPIQLHFLGQKTERRFLVSVHAEGARRVLTVTDLNLHTQKDSRTSLSMGEKSVLSASEDFSVKLSCIGVSLVDVFPQEVAFASAKCVRFQLLQNDSHQDATLEIAGLQVDNQLRHATYPVMLSATNTTVKPWGIAERRPEHQTTEKPAVVLKVSKWKHRTGSVDCFQCIYLSIAPLRLELEERNLARLVGLLRGLSVGGPNMGAESSMTFKVLQHSSGSGSFTNLRFIEIAEISETCKSWPDPAAVEPVKSPTGKFIASAKQKRKAYIEAFCIDPLELTISFSSIGWLPKETRESILWVTGSLLQRRLIALADVEGAPVRLRQLTLAHPMANWNAILAIAQRHYTRQLLHEVYKVLGSADVFGNPMGFMRSLGSGMWDFISAPAKSIRQNPVHVVQGVRLGTQSLFRNTIFAFSNAATQMSKAAHKGVAVLALDQDYLNEHEMQQYGRDSSIVNEFLEGLTGLLQSSVRGAERHGIPGAFSGMALGMLRAVARPAASMLEVAGKTAQSIRNSSRPAQPRVARVRLPRHLEPGSPLLPYSYNEAVGMAVLLEAESGRLKEEVYVTCQPLSDEGLYVLLTENLLLQVKWTGREQQDTDWSIMVRHSVEDILYIDRDGGTGTSLEVLLCTPSMFLAKGSATPSLAAAPSLASGSPSNSSSSSSSQHKGVVIKAGVVPSPFKNVTLTFGSPEAAQEFHSALLHVLGRRQSARLSRGQQ